MFHSIRDYTLHIESTSSQVQRVVSWLPSWPIPYRPQKNEIKWYGTTIITTKLDMCPNARDVTQWCNVEEEDIILYWPHIWVPLEWPRIYPLMKIVGLESVGPSWCSHIHLEVGTQVTPGVAPPHEKRNFNICTNKQFILKTVATNICIFLISQHFLFDKNNHDLQMFNFS